MQAILRNNHHELIKRGAARAVLFYTISTHNLKTMSLDTNQEHAQLTRIQRIARVVAALHALPEAERQIAIEQARRCGSCVGCDKLSTEQEERSTLENNE
ncbi:hypothetical protein [Spirosoma luteum]|uniref:hypothetical protein n=1 Tax=Spirosoma luteum TaxID=431553 RepID=UPI000379822E|nr:hypothetical protein [Spirosoma luteum]